MAKILDALKSADAGSLPVPPPVSDERARPVPPAPPPVEVEDMPFIEVGGPNRRFEASADVLAVVPPKIPASARPLAVEAVAEEIKPLDLSPENVPVVVTFQPWPPANASSRSDVPQELVVLERPDHPVSRQYFGLLQQLLGGEKKQQVLLFTSLTADQGTASVLLNLALAAARSGERKVAVVDAAGKGQAAAARLGLPSGPGLQEVIAGSVALEQALHVSPTGNLHVLSGATTWAGREFDPEVSAALRWIVRWLRGRFELIFVNAPVWDESPEFGLLLSLCDAVLPVVQESRIVQPRLHHMIQTITSTGAQVRGVIHANLLAA